MASGFAELIKQGVVATILLLVIAGLIWLVKILLSDAKEERALNREALINSTIVISELKELIRSALSK